MFKRTLHLVFSCHFRMRSTPAAHASQVEVNKQTGSQDASAVGHGNAVIQTLTRVATNWITQFRLLPSPAWNTSSKSLIKLLSKMVQPLGLAMPFCVDQTNIQKQFGFLITKVPNGFAGFVGF